ncbi:hypothetical protein FV219_04205 [Methylobacterium sp. WL122]|nr:hypothetical protein FV219_04205 [Methylobacterium sp. WL122]
MIQLAFEAAYDPFHAAYRILRQLVFRDGMVLPVTRAKILDVFIAEPQRCQEIRLSNPFKKSARAAAKCQMVIYGRRPPTSLFFNRMSPMQDAAIQTLVNRDILDVSAYKAGLLAYGRLKIEGKLLDRILLSNAEQIDLMKFLCCDLDQLPLGGANGLKDRTHLGEYRYDLV